MDIPHNYIVYINDFTHTELITVAIKNQFKQSLARPET